MTAAAGRSALMRAHPGSFDGGPKWEELKRDGFVGDPRKDEAYIGKHLGSTLIEITPERVASYIRRTDDDHPWYTKQSAFGRPVAPATLFPSHSSIDTSGWWMPNLHGNLHARQEWQFYSPMMVGDEVVASRTLSDRYTKRGRIYTVCEVNFTNAATGQLLARQRHHQSFVEDQSEEAVEAWLGGTSGARGGKSGGQVIAKVRQKMPHPDAVGEVLERFGPVRRTATRDLCERFAGAKAGQGFGNGHLDMKEASGMGFPGIVVVGVLSVAFLNELMTRRFGKGWFEGGAMDLKLVRPLWMGDTVEASGVVRRWEGAGPGRRRAVCDVWCHSSDGTVTVAGTAAAIDTQPAPRL